MHLIIFNHEGERFCGCFFSYLEEVLSILGMYFQINKSLTLLAAAYRENLSCLFACSKHSFLFYKSYKNVDDYCTLLDSLTIFLKNKEQFFITR